MATFTRREFVRRSARLGAAAALASQLEWLSACGGTVKKAPSQADWARLGARLKGTLVRPDDARYASLRLPFNRRYDYVHPQGIVVCAAPEDVSKSILWAREHEVPVAVRSGGHSYAGYSVSDGLVVDMGRLRSVEVNERGGTVTIGPGARNTDVYDGLQPHGVAFSAGRCPSVAISGLTLGGGFGFSSRRLGLSADALLETDVVTASGETITCSERVNSDLFWACRGGGGGNFGINTRFKFKTFPVDDVTLYDLSWAWRDARTVLAALQQVVSQAPDEWSLRVGLGSTGRPGATETTIECLGQFFGPKRHLVTILDPVLSAARPIKKLIAKRTFWQAKTYFYDTTPFRRFAVKSNYVVKPLSEEAIHTIVERVEQWPGSSNPLGAGVALFAWGGAISRVPPDATAFVHREAMFLMAYDTDWTVDDPPALVSANVDWLHGLADAIRPHVSQQAYQNFIDRSQPDWHEAYYGGNFDRLVQVKKKYDPNNFFHFEQSIPT
ncbi:MAG TPA: FAD-binding oxidoreductase [Gaiellaceae bacterium]